jgi:cytochrome c oxidase subunit 2
MTKLRWLSMARGAALNLALGSTALLAFLCGPTAAQNKPEPPVEIRITAKQFEFEPRTITVQKGKPVRLIITSADVDHGFKLEAFGINQKVPAKKTVNLDFTPDQVGKFEFRCSIVCGSGHEDMLGELVVVDAPQEKLNVVFDEHNPGVAIVEINGERLRVDTATKTWTRIEAPKPASNPPVQPQTATNEQNKKPAHEVEAYDYRLVNVPTPKRVVKGSLNLYFTHRFSQPIKPLNQSARQLLGLDSFSASSLGLFYGITNKLYVSVYRSPICQRGLCRTIEIGAGYHWLDEKSHSPVALSTYASIEGDNNFSRNFTYNLQAMVARSVTRYVHLIFSPAVHINANGQRRFDPSATDFFPPAAIADTFNQPKHAGSFGFGVNGRIRPTTSLLFEYTPRVGFKLGQVAPVFNSSFKVIGFQQKSKAEIGFGVQRDIGRHTFSLTFSNTQTTTTSRYNSSNLVLPPSKFVIGFNLYRRFLK